MLFNLDPMKALIEIKNEYNEHPVYLYQHSGSETLVYTVYKVLSLRKRWDDPDYLTRMLFCAMVPPEKWDGETGFGIGTGLYHEVELLITLDIPTQQIKIQKSDELFNYEEMTFNDFINVFYDSASL